MARLKPSEIKLVAALLEQPAADTGSLAANIIEALDTKRATDNKQFVIVFESAGTVVTFGPFPTDNTARKAVAGLASADPNGRPAYAAVKELRPVPEW